MASSDWPDYTHGVVLSSGGAVTDCPDWQEQVVAPGGGSIGGTTIYNGNDTAAPGVSLSAAGTLLATITPAKPVVGSQIVTWFYKIGFNIACSSGGGVVFRAFIQDALKPPLINQWFWVADNTYTDAYMVATDFFTVESGYPIDFYGYALGGATVTAPATSAPTGGSGLNPGGQTISNGDGMKISWFYPYTLE